ncbi:MAG TPA: cysteine--tRNA ligase [Candidatus Paceibacterota bacterium]
MEIYNTLTRKKERLEPREGKKVQMFVCGPTVYDYIHIGNARTFVFFDVVAKYLRHKGYGVNYIQNITDIDNKIIERAQKEGVNPLEYAKKYNDIFKEDMKSLGVTSPEYKNATDHIPEVIKQVQTLLDKASAYTIDGDGIYFDLSTFTDYGKLSGRNAGMADDAVSRIDDSDKKRNWGDFALWKFSAEGDPSWPAPFGDGRPGWHIEDTSITEKYFGPQYDIHGGGQDLIFPHHEAEIAQQESASSLKPFVKYWMHCAFLINKEEKMSKSKGNFKTAHDLLEQYPKEVLRFYILSGYYRSPLEFNDKTLRQSEAGVNRIYEFMQKLTLAGGSGKENIEKQIINTEKQFLDSMDNDFNTPNSLASIFSLIRNVNPLVSSNSLDDSSLKSLRDLLQKANSIFEIIPTKQKKIPKEIQELINKREEFRVNKNYDESDKIRTQMQDLGYDVEDTIYGPLVDKI